MKPHRRALWVVLSVLSLCCACSSPLTAREKGGLFGYLVGSAVGTGAGYATGSPALGAAIGGPVGAVAGVTVARGDEQSRELRALQEQVARQQEEVERLRADVRRLARKQWLEP